MNKAIFLYILTLSAPAWALVDSSATAETQALYSSLQAASGNYINFGIEYPDHEDTGCYPGKPERCGLTYSNSSVVRTGNYVLDRAVITSQSGSTINFDV